MSGCGQTHETAYAEVDMGAVFESELGQKEIRCVKGMCGLKVV